MALLKEVSKLLERTLRPFKQRLLLMISRAVIRTINDNSKLAELQLTALSGEILDRVEMLQHYGFSSHPLPGAESLIGTVGADRAHSVCFATEDRRYRPKKKAGETILYDWQGQKVHLTQEGIVIETSRPQGVTIRAPKASIETEEAVVSCTSLDLGGTGGQRVARIGDRVRVGSGSSAGLWPIVEGSEIVRAK